MTHAPVLALWRTRLLPGLVLGVAGMRFAPGTCRRTCRHLADRCIARALAQLGHPPGPVGTDCAGARRWPDGVTGSVTYARDRVVVVTAPRGAVAGLGIDIDTSHRIITPGNWRFAFSRAECGALQALPAAAGERTARALFSLKESAYKCFYHASGRRHSLAGMVLDARGGVLWVRAPDGLQCRARVLGAGAAVLSSAVLAA